MPMSNNDDLGFINNVMADWDAWSAGEKKLHVEDAARHRSLSPEDGYYAREWSPPEAWGDFQVREPPISCARSPALGARWHFLHFPTVGKTVRRFVHPLHRNSIPSTPTMKETPNYE